MAIITKIPAPAMHIGTVFFLDMIANTSSTTASTTASTKHTANAIAAGLIAFRDSGSDTESPPK